MTLYDRTMNQSRTSLTTNSSRATHIVRKRDSNFTINMMRSRSKNKQDQCNTSFQQYLNKCGLNVSTKLDANASKNGSTNACEEQLGESRGRTSSGLLHALSAAQLNKTGIIERGDRYINPRPILCPQNSQPQQKPNAQKNKKRSPTPIKSKKQLRKSLTNADSPTKNHNANRIFELQIKITGLQDMLSIQRQQKQRGQKKLGQALSDIENMRDILSRMEMENKILNDQKRQLLEKVQRLQQAMLQSEKNLDTVTNSLNKLRQTIKQNKLSLLQQQLKKHQKQAQLSSAELLHHKQTISTLSQQLQKITKQAQQYKKQSEIALQQSTKQKYLQKQLQRCKKQVQLCRRLSNSQKEMFLEEKVDEQERVIGGLKEEIEKMGIKLRFMEYFKSKEISDIKNNMDNQIKSLRVKYSKMIVQIRGTKKNSNNSASSNTTPKANTKSPQSNKPKTNYDIKMQCMPTSGLESRLGLMDRARRTQDDFLLQLSPQ